MKCSTATGKHEYNGGKSFESAMLILIFHDQKPRIGLRALGFHREYGLNPSEGWHLPPSRHRVRWFIKFSSNDG